MSPLHLLPPVEEQKKKKRERKKKSGYPSSIPHSPPLANHTRDEKTHKGVILRDATTRADAVRLSADRKRRCLGMRLAASGAGGLRAPGVHFHRIKSWPVGPIVFHGAN